MVSYTKQIHRKISNISRTNSQNWNDYRLVLQLSLPNPLKPGVTSRMKMKLEQRRQAMLKQHLSDQQVYCLLRCALYYRFYGNAYNFSSHYVRISLLLDVNLSVILFITDRLTLMDLPAEHLKYIKAIRRQLIVTATRQPFWMIPFDW